MCKTAKHDSKQVAVIVECGTSAGKQHVQNHHQLGNALTWAMSTLADLIVQLSPRCPLLSTPRRRDTYCQLLSKKKAWGQLHSGKKAESREVALPFLSSLQSNSLASWCHEATPQRLPTQTSSLLSSFFNGGDWAAFSETLGNIKLPHLK